MNRKIFVFVILNMLIITTALGVGFYAYATAGRFFARGVIYIAPRLNESHLHFPASNVELLDRAFPDYSFAVESRGSTRMVASFQSAVTTVIYTDAAYFTKHAMNFIDGTHWRDGIDTNVMVLNESLAWRLFGSVEDIAGMPVVINDIPFVVAGVVQQAGASGYTAWMPHEGILPVTAVYVLPENYNALSIYQARDMLTMHLRGRTVDYAVVDITRFVESMQVRNRILLYLVLIGVTIAVMKDAFKVKPALAVILGVAVGGIVALGVNDILSWLPNLSGRDVRIFESISMIGVLPPDGYLPYGLLQISRLSRYTNYAFIAGLIGLANLIFFRGWKHE